MTKLTRLVVGAALTFVAACASQSSVEGWEVVSSRAELRATDPRVESETWMVRSYGDHRVRVERVCGGEHCGTLAFLETLEGEFPRRVAAVVEIREFANRSGAFIRDVHLVRDGDSYAFDLVSVDPYGGLSGFTLRVWPRDQLTYEAELRNEFNNY